MQGALRDRPVRVDARGCLSVAGKGGYVSIELILHGVVQEPYFADFTKTAAGKRYAPTLPCSVAGLAGTDNLSLAQDAGERNGGTR